MSPKYMPVCQVTLLVVSWTSVSICDGSTLLPAAKVCIYFFLLDNKLWHLVAKITPTYYLTVLWVRNLSGLDWVPCLGSHKARITWACSEALRKNLLPCTFRLLSESHAGLIVCPLTQPPRWSHSAYWVLLILGVSQISSFLPARWHPAFYGLMCLGIPV
jgi:hypothetical protein